MTPAPATARGASSLKLSLILPFVALIALLTSALGMLWYWTGSKTVSSLSEQVMEEKAQRIAQMVERHIESSSAVLEAAFPTGMPVDSDIQAHLPQLTARLWMAT